MDPVLYTFILYFLYITLPLIPAILIYKFFPESKVGATGILGNLKINATGAFAAYIITSTMGYFIVRHAQGMISGSADQMWMVESKIVFLDTNNKPLTGDLDKMVKLTDIKVNPDYIMSKDAELVKFKVSGNGKNIIVTFSQNNFSGRTFDLSSGNNNIIFNELDRTVNLGAVVLKKIGTVKPPDVESLSEDTSEFGPPKN